MSSTPSPGQAYVVEFLGVVLAQAEAQIEHLTAERDHLAAEVARLTVPPPPEH